MLRRRLALFLSLVAVGCAAGGPPELGYRLPATTAVTYAYGDTTMVAASLMGQAIEIAMRGEAAYGVAFDESSGGLDVTLTVDALSASLSMPLAPPEQVDESDVSGALVFSLDRFGNATVMSVPEVSAGASRMISGLTTAHTFFPGLPGRVVSAGDTWVDTVAYEGDSELGAMTESSVFRYTVVGDTVVDGRVLTKIALAGGTELSNSMEMGGTPIAQSSTVEVEGHVLWDTGAGLMYELVRSGRGEGTVRVPLVPQPVPIRVELNQRARLVGG